jgi:hypothetical protein
MTLLWSNDGYLCACQYQITPWAYPPEQVSQHGKGQTEIHAGICFSDFDSSYLACTRHSSTSAVSSFP